MSAPAYPGWVVRLCRSTPGTDDAASMARSQGATVIWCGPGCTCGHDSEDGSMDNGADGGGGGAGPAGPETETRGGENPDWENARPGRPLPERHPEQDREPE